jgi:hypothetical protein
MMKYGYAMVFLAVFASCHSSGDSVRFRFQPEGQEAVKNRIEMEASSTLRLFTLIELRLAFTGDLEQTPENPSPGQNQWIKLQLSQVGLDLGVDQNLFGNEQLAGQMQEQSQKMAARYEKESIRVAYDELGVIQQLDPGMTTFEAADQDSLKAAAMNMERLLGANLLERLANLHAVLPQKAVRIGDQWTSSHTQDMLGMPVKLTNTYTFSSRENGKATFDVTGLFAIDSAKLEEKGVQLPFDGMSLPNTDQIRFLVKGTQKGQMVVDEKTGWTRSADLTQAVSMEFRLGALTIPVTVQNNIRVLP